MEDFDDTCMDENDIIDDVSAPVVDSKVFQRWGRPDVEKFDPKVKGIPALTIPSLFMPH